MTSTAISLVLSFLAMGLSVGTFMLARLARRHATELSLRASEEAKLDRKAAIDQLRVSEARMQLELEYTRALLGSCTAAEVGRWVKTFVSEEVRLRAKADDCERSGRWPGTGRRAAWDRSNAFAATEPMKLEPDHQPDRSTAGDAQDLRIAEAANTYANLAARLQHA